MCGALGTIKKPFLVFQHPLDFQSKTLKFRATPPEPDRAARSFNTLKVQLKKAALSRQS